MEELDLSTEKDYPSEPSQKQLYMPRLLQHSSQKYQKTLIVEYEHNKSCSPTLDMLTKQGREDRKKSTSPAHKLVNKYMQSLHQKARSQKKIPRKLIKNLQKANGVLEVSGGDLESSNLSEIIDSVQRNQISPSVHSRIGKVSSGNNFRSFSGKSQNLEEAQESFQMAMSSISPSKLLILKSIAFPEKDMVLLVEAFLTLFCKVDKNIEVNPSLDVLRSRIWFSFVNYISNPGNAIVTMRKFPELIKSQRIRGTTVKKAKDLFSKIKSPTLMILYNYLKCAFRLYECYNSRARSTGTKKTFIRHDPLFSIVKNYESDTKETPRFSSAEDEDEENTQAEYPNSFVEFVRNKLSDGNKLRNRNEVYKLHANWVSEYIGLYSAGEPVGLLNDTLKFKRLVNQLRLEILKEFYAKEKDKLMNIRQGLLEDFDNL